MIAGMTFFPKDVEGFCVAEEPSNGRMGNNFPILFHFFAADGRKFNGVANYP